MTRMTLSAIEALPEMHAGKYTMNPFFQAVLNFFIKEFPDAADLIEQAAAYIPFTKLFEALQTAYAEYEEGKDFVTILQDVLAQWVTITKENGKFKMVAKA